MNRIEDFVVRVYIRNRYPFEGYRATRSSRVPSGLGVAIFRTSPNRLSRKFVVVRYEEPLISPSSPRPPLCLSQSSYFWPSGMSVPTRETACCSSSALVMPLAPPRFAFSKLAPTRLASLRSARLRSAPIRLASLRSASNRLASLRSAPIRLAPLRSALGRWATRSALSSRALERSAPLRSAPPRLALGSWAPLSFACESVLPLRSLAESLLRTDNPEL